jgi:group I intron endonuclease
MITIYQLIDPRSQEIRYVGKSVNPKERYRRHIRDAKEGKTSSHKGAWIKQLLDLGLKPIQETIELVTQEMWQERERHWIEEYRNRKYRLTNFCDGGIETPTYHGMNHPCYGKPLSEETKAKISLKAKERWKAGVYDNINTEERRYNSRLRMIEFNRTRRVTDKTRKRMSESRSQPIELVDQNNIVCYTFNNAREAAEALGCKRSNVNNCRRRGGLLKRKYHVRFVQIPQNSSPKLESWAPKR